MTCTCHYRDHRNCPVHASMTPRQHQIQDFLDAERELNAIERRAAKRLDALVECDQYGHIWTDQSFSCARCGANLTVDDAPFSF